ncbi:MAG: hypothetical protein COB02_07920 [Candidatus Cloacimonadota bacterium]|nr:MAG: hypothetical protein COB02_07920 [Candidatus Cloacimonadota bacterium]
MTDFQKNSITWLLQLGKSASLYYGKLSSPYQIFNSEQDANFYIKDHRLGHEYKAVVANDKLLESYYSTCF